MKSGSNTKGDNGIVEIMEHACNKKELPSKYNKDSFDRVRNFHKTIKGYKETPLVRVESLEEELQVGGVFIKDESKRFGLKAFKGLGASYALDYALSVYPETKTVVTATDGNHGKAVAWAAHEQGLDSVIFMPKGTSKARSSAIEDIGSSTVNVTEVNYTDCVRMAAEYAKAHKGTLVQDTGFDGYTEIPERIVLGYSTMAAEAVEQLELLGKMPTHVFLQAGVGSMAAGCLGYLVDKYLGSKLPKFVILEEWQTGCIYESIKEGKFVSIDGIAETKMAGLNCGEPNPLILPELNEFAEFYVKCNDKASFNAMRRLSNEKKENEKITSGECGAVGTGVLMEIMTREDLRPWRERMCLDKDSVILLFSTEGDTDPENFEKVLRG